MMDQTEALKVLIQGINVAQKRGTYSLKEASILAKAAAVFVQPAPLPDANNVENKKRE